MKQPKTDSVNRLE